MLKFIQTHPPGSDCTAPYDVILDKPYTVGEFINEVLTTRSNEWGSFHLTYYTMMDYDRGKIIKNNIPDECMSMRIKEVKASGGWSAMDYYIKLE